MGPSELFRKCINRSVFAPLWYDWDGWPISGADFVSQYPHYAKAWRFAQLLDERSCLDEIKKVNLELGAKR